MDWRTLEFHSPETGEVGSDVKDEIVELVTLFDCVRWVDVANTYDPNINACIIGTPFNGYPHHLPLPVVPHWLVLKTIR